MYLDVNPQKMLSSIHQSNAAKSKITIDSATFAEKLRQIKSIITNILPQEKQNEILTHLEQLNEIYLSDVQKDRPKNDKNEEEGREKARKSEKVLLQVREGNKLTNDIKIEGQARVKSPDRKIEEKKFIKFEPRKVKGEVTPGLGNILKNAL